VNTLTQTQEVGISSHETEHSTAILFFFKDLANRNLSKSKLTPKF